MFETILTRDWLKNELNIELKLDTASENAKFKEYYLKVCSIISNNFFLKPSPSNIEIFIANGEWEYDEDNTVVSDIETQDERVYLFLLAQAKQLQYEKINGIGGMINNATIQDYRVCPEVVDILKMLGLWQRNFAIR